MDVINAIIEKEDWDEKINDENITNKWRNELTEQGAPEKAFDVIRGLLASYEEKDKKEYNEWDEPTYDWVAKLGITADELKLECKCDCFTCEKGYTFNESDYDSDDASYVNECKEKMSRPCSCEGQYREKSGAYLNNVTDRSVTIGDDLRDRFITNLNKYKLHKEIDHHPWSDEQVIDVIHPSLYCYIKDVTNVKSNHELADTVQTFQWLPTDIKVEYDQTDTVDKVTINSYINNLSTKEKELYIDIGEIFGNFVPAFNNVMLKMADANKIPSYTKLSDCQVIVKIGRTELTTENAIYNGGSWHLEGVPCEKIIATGIYYFDMKNISESRLNFRATIDDPSYDSVPYPQNGEEYVKLHYDMDEGEGGYHEDTESTFGLGSIKTEKEMCLVFPNYLQHKVSGFMLDDPDEPGYRDILVFFLVDPSHRVLSTADVSRQQKVMSLKDAKFYRELLMFERKYETRDQNKFFERGWSLCEH